MDRLTIGQRKLIEWRNKNGFSLREAAAFLTEKVNDYYNYTACNIPHATIQKWEKGTIPTYSMISKVVNHLIMADQEDWIKYE